MTDTTRKFISERISALQSQRIRPEAVQYEIATALYQIALELNRLAGTADATFNATVATVADFFERSKFVTPREDR